MQVEPYVFFEGRCEEALAFYERAIGAEVTFMMRCGEAPAGPDDGCAAPVGQMPPDKILHAAVKVGSTTFMASDGMCSGKPAFQGMSLSFTADSDAHAKRVFDALADGGQVNVPLGPTFFASSFGMVADRFGLGWMILMPAPQPAG